MKRFFTILAMAVLMGLLAMPVSAESAASRVDVYCAVNSEGDCSVTMDVTLRLEKEFSSLSFPLPASAKNVSMNNTTARVTQTASAVLVDISRITQGYQGTASLSFSYSLPEAVKVNPVLNASGRVVEKNLLLTIPLLNGFELPVEALHFTITMPSGDMTHEPYFTSVYRQESIASDLTILPITGSQIIGSSNVTMNDREGITMTMEVPGEMFPTVSTYVRDGNPELQYILIFAALAFGYWLLALSTWPILRQKASTPPQGITAGELGCRLTMAGGDLTMMVFTWAQLGYLLIALDGSGRVLLHKRMDMGNERSRFENLVFKQLFGTRRVVDATGMTYAKLARKVLKMVPEEKNMYRGNSGNMKIFRLLACVCQIFTGICVAMNMTGILWAATLLSVVLGLYGAVSAWLIQGMAYRTHLRGKVPVYIGMVCTAVWIGLGFLCGQIWIPLGVTLGQWVVGYFAAYGGRRSDLGRHDAGQVLGLRRYLKRLPKEHINRLLLNDPDYFFNMAPYALAMGVVNPYARRFGERTMAQCPYLIPVTQDKRTALEWGHLMADAADLMDEKSRRMEWEKWFTIPVKVSREPAPKGRTNAKQPQKTKQSAPKKRRPTQERRNHGN